jgi:hypothetical protein
MSYGHLLMAAVTTAYILVAIVLEERDLLSLLGDDYRSWRASTPKFIPSLAGSRPVSGEPAVGHVAAMSVVSSAGLRMKATSHELTSVSAFMR